MKARVKVQTSTAGYHVSAVPGIGPQSFSVTMYPDSNGAGRSVFQQVGQFIRDEKATVLSQRVFTGPGTRLDSLNELILNRGGAKWPVTTLQGNGACSTSVTHIQLDAVSGVTVKPLECRGRILGAVYEHGDVTYCVLGDLRPHDLTASRCDQARSVFEQLETALDAAGMSIEHVVRTWFFIDRILDWYGQFNAVRSSLFDSWGLFDRILPASTGIGAANSAGAALIADALAIKSANRTVEITDVASPLQCAAMKYKSSFSRAVEVNLPGQRRLYVSGTASIAPDGRSVHDGDLNRQIALSMDVVREILLSRDMNWSDVTRGVAYFREACKMPALERYLHEHGLSELPVAVASADICRDDLLFEIELDAAVAEDRL